jgi:F0F1-type ATP synthase beta subunit
VGEDHYNVATRGSRSPEEQGLQDIIAIWAVDELSEETSTVARAPILQFLSQNTYMRRSSPASTIYCAVERRRGVKRIANGDFDHVEEQRSSSLRIETWSATGRGSSKELRCETSGSSPPTGAWAGKPPPWWCPR